MSAENYDRAEIANFTIPGHRILFGNRLKEVRRLRASIKAFGLLNPIIALPRNGKLIVIDGKKRLMALRKLGFTGDLPRSLSTIPYVIVGTERAKTLTALSLNSNRDSVKRVYTMRRNGMALMDIAAKLYISKACVKDLLNVNLLSPRLKQAFYGGTISLEQARAFVTLPCHDAQDNLMRVLGPFAAAPDILTAIESGETVIDMGDDNIIILPSRRPDDRRPLAA